MSDLVGPTRRPSLTTRQKEALTPTEKAFGGRMAILDALQYLPPSSDLDLLRAVLAEPENDVVPLPVLLDRHSLQPHSLLTWLLDAAKRRSHFFSQVEIYQRLPDLARNVMDRALPSRRECEFCLATGWITPDPTAKEPNPSPQECPHCEGTGVIVTEPSRYDREWALKIGGLLKDSGIHLTQSNRSLSVTGVPATLDRLVEALDRSFYADEQADRRAIEGAVEPNPSEDDPQGDPAHGE